MKKAALITHGPLHVIGGVERSHRYFIQFLEKEGFGVDVFEPSSQNLPSWVPGFYEPFRQFFFTGLPARKLQSDYDLIVTSGYTGGYLKGAKVLNYCFGSVKSCTGSFDAHQADWKLTLMNRVAVFFDALTRKGKTCVVISDQVAEEIKKDYGASGMVVQCAVDTDHFAPRPSREILKKKWGIESGLPVGAYVGRWAWNQKGLDFLTQVMREREDIHWLIAPDAEIKVEGVKYLTVRNDTNYDSLPEIYSLADFSIQLSRYESFGYAFVESLSCGTPVVATLAGVVGPAYKNSELQALALPLLHKETDRMLREVRARIDLMKDKKLRERLSPLCRQKALEEYSLNSWALKMKTVLRGMKVLS